MADALAANLASQRDFVANASHQLRTPLTGMKLRLEAIRAQGGPAAEEAEKAEAELDRLSALVDDLLGLAGASSLPPEAGLVDLGAIAREAVERWAEPARAEGRELRLVEGAAEPAWAAASDVAQILDNLLENAIRYSTPGGEITVEASGRSLVVSDAGPGIPEDERASVFERFYRGPRAGGRPRGTGSAWRSSRSSRGAGTPSRAARRPGHADPRSSFPPGLSTPHPVLTVPEGSPLLPSRPCIARAS